MIVETTVRRIGNSQGITIPKDVCDEIGLSLGATVQLSTQDGAIVIAPKKSYTLTSLMRGYDGPKPGEIDQPAGSVGREMW